jgi:3-hydroxyisobutyrate dehydrogenase
MTGKARIGFIGIGNMGWPMAANIVRSGFPLIAFDTDRARTDRFTREFAAVAADDLRHLGRAADILITMLPTGAVVREVLLEAQQGSLLASLAPGATLIDMGSSEPLATRELGAVLAARDIAMVDAPVSGGVPRAETGKLAIMIGSDDAGAVARVEPVLTALGDRLFRTGRLGSGHAMKALNNFTAAAGYTAAVEALIIGRRFGLEAGLIVDVLNASTGRNFSTESVLPGQVLTRQFNTGFALGLLAKDVRIAADLGEDIGADAPLSRLIRRMWEAASESLGADQDHSSAIRHWEKVNGFDTAP